MRDIQAMVDIEKIKQHHSDRPLMTGEYAAHLPLNRGAIRYCCPVCGNEFANPANALSCRDRYFDTGGLCVGDLVIIPNTWCAAYKEDDPWVAFTVPANMMREEWVDLSPRPMPYFVVTAIHVDREDKHKCLVTVSSLAGGSLRVGHILPARGEGYEFHRPGYFYPDASKSMYWQDRITDLVNKCKPSETIKEEAASLAAIKISSSRLL
jgi:hypothetical protein